MRTSAPPVLPGVQTSADGWQWNQRTNTGSYATRSGGVGAGPSASTSTQTDGTGGDESSAPVTRRARAGTVTRGNFRGGDEDMRDRSDEEDGNGETSFGEEDVEMS